MENLEYSYELRPNGVCPEHTEDSVNKLWDACMKHFGSPPFTIQIPDDMNEKSAELLRRRGFNVVRFSDFPLTGLPR